MRILHRYILRDMVKALALALAAVAGLFSFGLVLPALQEFGLGPLNSLLYMVLIMPRAAYLALPLSAALAGSLVYGRLASENELMACRASGVPRWSLFWPTIVLAAVTGAVTFVLGAWPLPESKYTAKALAMSDVESLFFSELRRKQQIEFDELNFQMTVDRVAGDMLYGPTLKYRDKDGQTYCYAPYGRASFDRETNRVRLTLSEAVVVAEADKVPLRGTHRVSVQLPTHLPREEDELSLWYLLAAQTRPDLTDRYQRLPEDASPSAERHMRQTVRARVMAELHGRLALAVGCFGLVVVGAGLGMMFHSGNLLTAFGVSLIPGLSALFITMAAVETVSRATEHPEDEVYLIWTPNFAVLLLGLGLLAYLSWVWSSPNRLRDLVRRPRR
jgi:lipopolysaccharide export LptBFGC system permease protein LptF